jgi:hypothetical protein
MRQPTLKSATPFLSGQPGQSGSNSRYHLCCDVIRVLLSESTGGWHVSAPPNRRCTWPRMTLPGGDLVRRHFTHAVISGMAAVTLSGCSGSSTGASPGHDLRPLSTVTTTTGSSLFASGLDKNGLTFISGPTGPISSNGFYVAAGVCTGSTDGHCGAVVFFSKGSPVGSIGTKNPFDVRFESENGTDVILDLPIYKDSDPLCCPSGGSQTVDFRWNGSNVTVVSSTPGPAPVVDSDDESG